MFREVSEAFPNAAILTEDGLSIPERARPLTRMIARAFDAYDLSKDGHSPAV